MFKSIVRQVGIKHCEDCAVNYRYYSRTDKVYKTNITGFDYTHYEWVIDYTNDEGKVLRPRITIKPDGTVTVYENAGSDGCTPVWLFFNWYYFGVSNGPVDPVTMEPVTARAFFLHDWLLKIRKFVGIPVDDIHAAFCTEIMKIKYWRKKYYCKIVTKFGPQN